MSDDRAPELPASWEAIVRRIAREVAVEVVESAEDVEHARGVPLRLRVPNIAGHCVHGVAFGHPSLARCDICPPPNGRAVPRGKDCADHGPPKEAVRPRVSTDVPTPAPQRGTATGALSEDSEEFRLASMYFAEFHDQHAALANDFRAYGDARVREATAKLREAAEAMVWISPFDSDWRRVRAELQDEIEKASGG